MSSRALRRLNKDNVSSSSVDTADEPEFQPQPKSSFACLANADDLDGPDDPEASETVKNAATATNHSKKRNRKKKKKLKGKEEKNDSDDEALEEALKALQVTGDANPSIGINVKYLDPDYEMLQMFGPEIMKQEAKEKREELFKATKRLPPSVKHLISSWGGPDGKSVPGLRNRKLYFSKVQPEWPVQQHRNMSMLSVSGTSNSYRFVHDQDYQESQHAFFSMSELGDTELLVNALQKYPYNVSLLSHLSDMANMSHDSSTARRLIDQAMFVFDRAFHPRFVLGSSKLPIEYYENRLFYVSLIRRIKSLQQQNAWRSALEHAKLLYSLDDQDPYNAEILIAILSLKSNQFDFLISFNLPDSPSAALLLSVALAHVHRSNTKEAKKLLEMAMLQPSYAIEISNALGFAVGDSGDPIAKLYATEIVPLWAQDSTHKNLLLSALSSSPLEMNLDLSELKPNAIRLLVLYTGKPPVSTAIWADDPIAPHSVDCPYPEIKAREHP
ncbi:hypothetical protein CANCADRAFT_31080 [Tortispora caseinolytica NRRL Y-17796]|uniref:Ribosome quality control complex subunit 1 n=1 Tax=Tortispora caseinolytica NRRL Y-17796 TaxID=767744 RepID=A0A1E4TE92_9ASCO|nr:hypothetical protein CANCADRAFT_31080 [Tortispora caseinolytica NRRL Y-17796]